MEEIEELKIKLEKAEKVLEFADQQLANQCDIIKELADVATGFAKEFESMADSGDFGNWKVEDEECYKNYIAVLDKHFKKRENKNGMC